MNNEEKIVEEETIVEEEKVTSTEKDGKPDTNYVKIRVDRAKTQREKQILQDLGVEKVDDAKKLIEDGKLALEEGRKLKTTLEKKEHEAMLSQKKSKLIKLLDKEKVFDSEALANYVDLDKVQIDNGEIQDGENIIASLKKAKPNFFGSFELKSDNYLKGGGVPEKTALEKQKEGNTIGAITDYLNQIAK